MGGASLQGGLNSKVTHVNITFQNLMELERLVIESNQDPDEVLNMIGEALLGQVNSVQAGIG